MNAFLLRSSLYIDEEDHSIANQYIDAVTVLCENVTKFGDDEDQLARDSTIMYIPNKVNGFEIARAQDKAQELRRKLIKKYKRILKI